MNLKASCSNEEETSDNFQETIVIVKDFFLSFLSGTFTCGTSPGSSVLICQMAMMDGRLMMPHLKRQVKVCQALVFMTAIVSQRHQVPGHARGMVHVHSPAW